MNCPLCGWERTLVRDTCKYSTVVLRVRVCPQCHRYFATAEEVYQVAENRRPYDGSAERIWRRRKSAKTDR